MKALIACMALMAGTIGANAEEWPPASDYLALASTCNQDDERCTKWRVIWNKDYNGAISGDYQGQRNVSFCLSTGCPDTYNLSKNPILGCAWRVVILESGHLQADATDPMNFKHYCGPNYLNDAERIMAQAQARTLLKRLGK